MKKVLVLSMSAVAVSVIFSGCIGELGSVANSVSSVMHTGTSISNMIQSVEVNGAKTKDFSKKDFDALKELAIQFKGTDTEYWLGNNAGFSDNMETELIKQGFSTLKYATNETNTVREGKAETITAMAKKLKAEGVDALITGTVTTSHAFSSSFGSMESKAMITGVTFSIISTTNGKTMASVNMVYKKGVTQIEASKDISMALKGLVQYPDVDIAQSFEEIKSKKA
ncbi:MAG: hypothetical protein Q7U00_08165 [Sulfurimonas sp.]|nr:hypothetical protein [Sulfurimonas sp.]